MTASNRRLLMSAFFAILLSTPAHAVTDIWFYEWRDPAQFVKPAQPQAGGEVKQHWVLTEFDGEPYVSQLEAVREARGFQRISLLFKFPPSAALADEYSTLAGALAGRGVSLQYKFEGSLPNASEVGFLKRACDAGASLVFITN